MSVFSLSLSLSLSLFLSLSLSLSPPPLSLSLYLSLSLPPSPPLFFDFIFFTLELIHCLISHLLFQRFFYLLKANNLASRLGYLVTKETVTSILLDLLPSKAQKNSQSMFFRKDANLSGSSSSGGNKGEKENPVVVSSDGASCWLDVLHAFLRKDQGFHLHEVSSTKSCFVDPCVVGCSGTSNVIRSFDEQIFAVHTESFLIDYPNFGGKVPAINLIFIYCTSRFLSLSLAQNAHSQEAPFLCHSGTSTSYLFSLVGCLFLLVFEGHS